IVCCPKDETQNASSRGKKESCYAQNEGIDTANRSVRQGQLPVLAESMEHDSVASATAKTDHPFSSSDSTSSISFVWLPSSTVKFNPDVSGSRYLRGMAFSSVETSGSSLSACFDSLKMGAVSLDMYSRRVRGVTTVICTGPNGTAGIE